MSAYASINLINVETLDSSSALMSSGAMGPLSAFDANHTHIAKLNRPRTFHFWNALSFAFSVVPTKF